MNRDMTRQRVDAISNAHAGREFEAYAKRLFANRGIHLNSNLKVMVGIGVQKKNHAFDLGCRAQKIWEARCCSASGVGPEPQV